MQINIVRKHLKPTLSETLKQGLRAAFEQYKPRFVKR